MLSLHSKYYHLLYHRCVMLLSFTLLLNMIFLGPYATAGDITIKGKGDQYTFKLTGVSGYKAD